MRKFLKLIFILLVVGFIFWQKNAIISGFTFLTQSPCDQPITYRIGRVDSGYQLSKGEFFTKVEKAAGIWEQALSKNIFVFDEQSPLTINLVYSQRQSILDKLEGLEGNLADGRGSLDKMIAEYQTLSKDFKLKIESFNKEVSFWNQKGGAPREVYEQLIRQQESLEIEASRVNDLARHLNLSVNEYNLEVGQYNENVQDYNFVSNQRPEAGLYDGRVPKIDIYLTLSEDELIHTLAHELGHAWGIEHINDVESIMHSYSSEKTTLSRFDFQAIEAICEEKNWEIYLWQIISRFVEE
ncbi:matrixin family metalloprotease [Patescibacteria group bacterium]